MKLNNEVHIFV